MSDPTYDFNYQQWRPTNLTILPGDGFVLECNYSSTTPEVRKNSTIGGFSTHDEMCYAFLFVTPEIDLKGCSSTLDYNKLRTVLKFDDIPQPSGNFSFDKYTKYKAAVQARIRAIDWENSASMKLQLEDLYLNNPHNWACSGNTTSNYLLGVEKVMPEWKSYSPPDECEKTFSLNTQKLTEI